MADETPTLVEELRVLRAAVHRSRIQGPSPDTSEIENLLIRAADAIEEYDSTFDLRWKADMRAIKRWRKANPGNDLVLPDHADLVVWLLGQSAALANAANMLAQKLTAIHGDPRYEAVWTVAMLHGAAYDGPTYAAELRNLQDVLVDPVPDTGTKTRKRFMAALDYLTVMLETEFSAEQRDIVLDELRDLMIRLRSRDNA